MKENIHLRILTIAGSALVFALVVAVHLFERPTHLKPDEVNDQGEQADVQSNVPVRSATDAREPVRSRTEVTTSPSDRSKTTSANKRDVQSPSDLPVRPSTSDSLRSEQESEADVHERVDESVVGRPFPLSPSLMRTCISRSPSESECPRLVAFLSEFELEARKVLWAREMEVQLQKALTFPDAERFTVRKIECRSNRCIAEVSAPYEWNLGDLDNFPELSAVLYGPVVGDLGFEMGPNGEKIIVTAMGFERR